MLSTKTEGVPGTVIADWYQGLAGNRSARRNHWATKVIYYRAVAELLDARPAHPLTWKSIVGAAPGGCRSTFYEVAGSQARRGMVRHLIADGSITSATIALHYRTTDPVVQLIDEAKVWSFWPYRQRLRPEAGAADPAQVPEPMRALLTEWAGEHPGLAAANRCRPPACVVEDLTVLSAGQLAPTRAEARVTDVLRHALVGGH